ncbi:major facilitator superfamily domain-containing protein [Bisporella sp. PMI_857]|nr:major facilitator superfamily domain-containing protein [Bisporella sp. PMI_857]
MAVDNGSTQNISVRRYFLIRTLVKRYPVRANAKFLLQREKIQLMVLLCIPPPLEILMILFLWALSLSRSSTETTAYCNGIIQWPRWKKHTTLFLVSAYSFLANSSLLGASVYVNHLAHVFSKTPNETSRLVTYPNLLFGFGSLIFVPMYHRLGRRPVMLMSIIVYAVGLLGCALASSYEGLLAFRIVHAFGSSVCEALPAQVVNDVFFLHERGKALGWYTFAIATGALGALPAGYVLSGGRSYKVFFWIEFSVAVALFLGAFFLFEETMFFRQKDGTESLSTETNESGSKVENVQLEFKESNEDRAIDLLTPRRRSWAQQLKVIDKDRIDHESPVIMMVVRSFTYYLVPPVFWVCSTYGMVIGLAGLVFTSTFPVIVASPPYNWPIENTGLVSLAALVGYFAAAGPFSTIPDRFSAYLTRRNNGIREAEFRLWCLVPVFFVSPASLILYGYAAERLMHWTALMAAIGMFQFGAFFYLTYTLAYALDSYESNIPEMLIAMNVGKQAISFGFGFEAVQWILNLGYIRVVAGIFCGVLVINNLAVLGFLGFGKPMRTWFSQTWLASFHKNSIRE